MPIEKILFVDDNPATNLINRRLIEKNNLAKEIIVFTSVNKALTYISTKDDDGQYPRPDLAFIDLNLPGMNGWDFLDAFVDFGSEMTDNTTCVILTTSDNQMDESKAADYDSLGGYLKKPLTLDKVQTLIS